MLIENMMYFALGLLVAGLVALIILPAVWKRAVRLTKRRIEAATPITMAEFRADKDQLRAEFALSTRRLEMNIETLRGKLTEQLAEVNQKRADAAAFKAERDQLQAQVQELEATQTDLRARLGQLEQEGTALTERLHTQDRSEDARTEALNRLRTSLPPDLPIDPDTLTGDYSHDTERLAQALAEQSQRTTFLEDQARSLIERLEHSDRKSAETAAAITSMRETLQARDEGQQADRDDLVAAEARIASAESRLNALLAETGSVVELGAGRSDQSLADKLTVEADVESLRNKVANVESSILAADTDQLEETQLRGKLNDIAASTSRLVYAVETESPVGEAGGESLFDRVQRFADPYDGHVSSGNRGGAGTAGTVSERMAAIREIQGR